jgi:hypothetical protein
MTEEVILTSDGHKTLCTVKGPPGILRYQVRNQAVDNPGDPSLSSLHVLHSMFLGIAEARVQV